MQTIGDILRDTVLKKVFTFGNCTFCETAGLTYTDLETRCLYCLPCLVIAVEGKEEEPEDPEITQMGRDYLAARRLAA